MNVGTRGTPGRYPEPDTSDRRRSDIELGLDCQLEHIRSGAIAVGQGQAGSWGLEVDWGQPVARLLHLPHVDVPPRLCASFLLLSYAASTLYGFP